MVIYEEIYNATKVAFEKKHLYELLTGKEGYDVPVLDTPIDVPTDWTAVIPNGIYKLYKDNNAVAAEFTQALYRMMAGDSTDLWIAANILFIQLKSQKRGTAPFSLDQEVLLEFNKQLLKKHTELEKNNSYGGNQYSNGLLGDIERLNRILFNKYLISMVI